MNRELDAESIGEQLGIEGVGSVVSKVEAYCACEEQRIELTNQPRIGALRQEGSLLLEEERALTERLRHAPPPGDLRSRGRKAAYYWGITIVLTIAAFVFSLLAFDPFRVGWKSYLYCSGIALVTPFLLEQVLEKWNGERVFKAVAVTACAAALTSLVLLAVIRGDVFAEQMKNTAPVIILDDAPSQPEPEHNFYDAAVGLLRLVMALLAVATELGTGLALHAAWRIGSGSSEDWEKLRTRQRGVRERMVAIAFEIKTLENEAAVFAARFWRNFYRAMLTHSVRSAMTKIPAAVLAVLLVVHGRAIGQERINLVIAIDLSQSVAVAGPDHKTEFQKNIEASTKLLAQVPAGSHVTIIGITDKSFAQPDILLSATIPDHPGYFGERLKSAQLQLARTWKSRSAELKPEFHRTDILGALVVASQLFSQGNDSGQRVLVLFSDMRHSMPDLNLESPSRVPSFSDVRKRGHISPAELQQVRVCAMGVHGTGKSLKYWESLRQFWSEYFLGAGADLRCFSVLHDPPGLILVIALHKHIFSSELVQLVGGCKSRELGTRMGVGSRLGF
jgi:hypothetical protein